MPSFDIVSKVEIQEVDNAVNQTMKEIAQRRLAGEGRHPDSGRRRFPVEGGG
jgi:hypothetical protein